MLLSWLAVLCVWPPPKPSSSRGPCSPLHDAVVLKPTASESVCATMVTWTSLFLHDCDWWQHHMLLCWDCCQWVSWPLFYDGSLCMIVNISAKWRLQKEAVCSLIVRDWQQNLTFTIDISNRWSSLCYHTALAVLPPTWHSRTNWSHEFKSIILLTCLGSDNSWKLMMITFFVLIILSKIVFFLATVSKTHVKEILQHTEHCYNCVHPVCCGRTWLACTEPWPQPCPKPLGGTGIPTAKPHLVVGRKLLFL